MSFQTRGNIFKRPSNCPTNLKYVWTCLWFNSSVKKSDSHSFYPKPLERPVFFVNLFFCCKFMSRAVFWIFLIRTYTIFRADYSLRIQTMKALVIDMFELQFSVSFNRMFQHEWSTYVVCIARQKLFSSGCVRCCVSPLVRACENSLSCRPSL